MRHSRIRALGLVAIAVIPAWAEAATFTPLGDLAGGVFQSEANGISADGSVIVGQGRSAAGFEAFRWTSGTGLVGLGDLPGDIFRSAAYGVSADGAVVVGYSKGTGGVGGDLAFRWTTGTGMVSMGTSPTGSSGNFAWAASGNGSVVVGQGPTGNTSAFELEAFRWTTGDGLTGLGDLPDGTFSAIAWDVSADGSVVVGQGNSASGIEGFRWASGTGLVGLGDLPDGDFASVARAVTPDGSVIVGYGTTGTEVDDTLRQRAVSWTAGGGPVALDDGADFSSLALDVSADGSVVVGYAYFSGTPEAFVWTEANGMQRLFDLLVANGATGLTMDEQVIDEETGEITIVTTPLWSLTEVRGISADGLTLVGVGTNQFGDQEAFTANLAAVPVGPTAPLLATGIGLLGWFRRRRTATA